MDYRVVVLLKNTYDSFTNNCCREIDRGNIFLIVKMTLCWDIPLNREFPTLFEMTKKLKVLCHCRILSNKNGSIQRTG